MTYSYIDGIIKKQRAFFRAGDTRSEDFRVAALGKLYKAIAGMEDDILDALKCDLGKSREEGFISEIGIVLHEISHAIRNLRRWSRSERRKTPLVHQPAASRIYRDPFGVCLIIAPWNYPFQLMMSPLIGAIAGGNTAVLKPSEIAPATSKIIEDLVADVFDRAYVAVVQGGIDLSRELLDRKWDKIFFTGSVNVGKAVMKAAAEHLTPVTLELGGKSPAIVDSDADLSVSARRVAFGKWLNAGQTCIAPDYILIKQSIAAEFLDKLVEEMEKMYGKDSNKSEAYGRIVDEKRWQRLDGLLHDVEIIYGGRRESRYFQPTIVRNPGFDHPLMQEEIFGPILPVLTFSDLGEAIEIIERNPDPLALYYFGSRGFDRLRKSLRFGGACVNDTIVHIATFGLPFGGVGTSGMGRYHGRASFDAFTYEKSVMERRFSFDLRFRYPPYSEFAMKIIRQFFR